MRRALIALFFMAGFALSAAPAVADDGADGSTDTVTSPETSDPTPSDSPPPPEDTTPPPPEESTPPSSDETPATDATPDTDKPGTDKEPDAGTPDQGTPGTGSTGTGNSTSESEATCESTGEPAVAGNPTVITQADAGVLPPLECLVEDALAIVILAAPEKIRICHSTSAEANPYVGQNPNANGDVSGHADHTGGVFPDDPWGDIIPPFDFEGGSFPGLNWTAEGQAIYFNGCNVPDEEPPPPGEEEISICHADANPNQPYGPGPISPSVNSIVNPNGHGTHTGPVFFPGIAEQWGDIIPPFEYGDNESFPGLNWDADGQAIFFNDCIFSPPDDDDDDDGDDDGDDDDGDDDGDDDDKAAALPDTGGPSLWILTMGGLMMVLGLMILTNRESMLRAGMFVRVPIDQPTITGRHVRK